MSILDTFRNWIIDALDIEGTDNSATRQRITHMAQLQEYYEGHHKRQLKVKVNKFDDNLIINLCGLIVDKSVSALVGDPDDGDGLSWTFPSEVDAKATPPPIEWLDQQWEANNRAIWLHKNALAGAESGLPAVKMAPDGAGNIRLVNLNPLILDLETDPQDMERITAYNIRYRVIENDKTVGYKEVTKPNDSGTAWQVETYKQLGRDRWVLTGPAVAWNYPFPPILTWQNLPRTDSPYGRSDIEGLIDDQDRYNFVMSNISKVTRLFAHPQRYARNLSAQMRTNPKTGEAEMALGPDEMPAFTGDGEIVQLQPAGDVTGMLEYAQVIRGLIFSLAREVDIESLKDKVGAITNFGLRILYRDFLDKLGTKRMLYGAAYQELNRRLLQLGGYEPETCEISWPDPLPVNETEETQGLQVDMGLGLVSKQTAREIRGYDNKNETERMTNEATSANNAGGLILENFFKTGR